MIVVLNTPPFVQEIASNLLQVFMGAKNNGRAIGNVVWSHKPLMHCHQIPKASKEQVKCCIDNG